MISNAEKQEVLKKYLATPEGRAKLILSVERPGRLADNWCYWEHVGVARFLEIDYERVTYERDGPMGPCVRVRGMTHRDFMRWAPKLHKKLGLSLAYRESEQP